LGGKIHLTVSDFFHKKEGEGGQEKEDVFKFSSFILHEKSVGPKKKIEKGFSLHQSNFPPSFVERRTRKVSRYLQRENDNLIRVARLIFRGHFLPY
jgi:hypothetical protein